MPKKMMPMRPQMLATSDGGVVVLSGRKLVKYDASLKLVEQAELPPDGPKEPLGDAGVIRGFHGSENQ